MSKLAGKSSSSSSSVAASAASGATPAPASSNGRVVAAEEGAPIPIVNGELELFRRAQHGDRGAFGQIVRMHQDRLYNAVLRVVGNADEALELTQETFTRALVKLDGFRGDAQPYTWLFRIALNLAISQLRKVQRQRTFSLDAPPRASASGDQAASLVDRVAAGGQPSPSEAIENRERDEQVLAALGRIDVEYRAVLIMRDIEGFDYQQMADVLSLPLGTLKSRLFRARVALRDELKPFLDAKPKDRKK